MRPSYLQRNERFLFAILVIIHLIPVCSTRFFPTLDGPAHLYNSNLINWMLSGAQALPHHYFSFNSQPVPNLLTHVVLCIFNSIFPAFLAEKITMVLYIILFPLSFRGLAKQLNVENSYLSYLVFPFIYSVFFFKGFYNFCFSLPLYFFTLAYWFKIEDKIGWKHAPKLALLFVLLYFSHLLSFLLLLGNLVFFIAWEFTIRMLNCGNEAMKQQHRKNFFRQLFFLLSTAFPFMILSLTYIGSHYGKNHRPGVTHLAMKFFNISPLFQLSYTALMSWLFFLLSGAAVFLKWKRRKRKDFFNLNDGWLLLFFVLLLLFFIIPDETATGGFVSDRMVLFMYLTIAVWLMFQPIWKPAVYVAVLTAVFVSMVTLRFLKKEAVKPNLAILECEEVARLLPENSILLPLNYSGDLITFNLLTYLGSEKRILVLDNYEARTTHFPLQWKNEFLPDDRPNNFLNSNRPCINLRAYEKRLGKNIDYVAKGFYSDSISDSCTLFINKQLESDYQLFFKKKYIAVYQRKIKLGYIHP